jgi:hypothetical protein
MVKHMIGMTALLRQCCLISNVPFPDGLLVRCVGVSAAACCVVVWGLGLSGASSCCQQQLCGERLMSRGVLGMHASLWGQPMMVKQMIGMSTARVAAA